MQRLFSGRKSFLIGIIAALFALGGIFIQTSSAHAATVYASGTITTAQTWVKTNVYVIQSSLTVGSGGTLTINSSTVVKLDQGAILSVAASGTLKAQGAATGTIYFTSLKDNSVAPGTNGTTTTTAAPGDWGYIEINSGASSTMTWATIRYGGGTYSPYANIYQTGGNLTLSHIMLASSSNKGIQIEGGNTTISTSTISNNGSYGILESGSGGTLTLTTSTFSNNTSYSAYIDLGGGFTFTPSGNSASGSGYRGFFVETTIATNTVWYKDLPYITNGLTITSGATLTVNHGAIVKLTSSGLWDVSAGGTLNVQGISTDKVYFTSIADDSVGGDTNYDGASTAPQPGDWVNLEVDSGASTTITNAIIRYGGGTYYPHANIYQTGGKVMLSGVTIASSSNEGIHLTSGTAIIATSQLLNNPYGIAMEDGTADIINSSFSNNPTYAFLHYGAPTSSAFAEYNYWGSAAGPYNATQNPGGVTSSTVSDYVDFAHWLMSWSASSTTSTIIAVGQANQFNADGVTPIDPGAIVADSKVVFGGTLLSMGTSSVQLQVEVKPAGVNFTNTANVTSSFILPNTYATATFIGVNAGYHWQARAVAQNNNSSTWQRFGPSATSTDFTIGFAKSVHFNESTDDAWGWPAVNVDFSATNPFTIEFWYRTAAPTSTIVSFIDARNGAGLKGYLIERDRDNGIFFSLKCSSGSIQFYSANASSSMNGSEYDTSGIWHQVAVTKSMATSSGAFNLYFDGISQPLTVNYPTPLSGNCFNATSTDSIWFWQGPNSTTTISPPSFLAGDMDEVRIWNVERTAGNILANWNQETTSTTNIKGLWQFNGNSNDLITGHAPSGQIGTPSFSASTPFGHFLMDQNLYPNSVRNGKIWWYNSSSQYIDEVNVGSGRWNSLGGRATIASTTSSSTASVIVSDVNITSTLKAAAWDPSGTLIFNIAQLPTSTTDQIYMAQFAATHELGHALGLDHSYWGNIMNYYLTTLQVLGPQDKNDYNFLWGN